MDLKNKSYKVHTYGCKVNTYDTGLLQARLDKAGYTDSGGTKPQVHILNTCAVTAEATREAVRKIRQIKSKDPSATVVITGCAAQVDTDSFKVPGADLVIANSHKGQMEELLEKYFKGELEEKIFHSNIFKKDDLEAGGGMEKGHTRAFLKVQDGCNSFCTYCVIPFARGKSRSIPIDDLVSRVNELYREGAREVVLTGVHIGDYASSKSPSEILAAARGRKAPEKFHYLEGLVEALLAQTSVPRFRLASLEPVEVTDRLLESYKNEKMCPQFHMSIQSANTKVLRDMKRNYNAEQVEEALLKIADRVSGAFIGMDVIVGFPGESDSEFEDTFARLERLPWTRIHVFPYSERPGTKAVLIDEKVPQHKISERARKLRELSSERYAMKALEQIGQVKKSLLLKNNGTHMQALSRDYWNIQVSNSVLDVDFTREYDIEITGFDSSEKSRMDGLLVGRVL